jgi:hypothetical protein
VRLRLPLSLLALLLVAAAAGPGSVAGQSPPTRPKPGAAATAFDGAGQVYGYGHVVQRLGQIPPRGFTGGPITTTATGETFTLYTADEYLAADPQMSQRFADVVAGFLHGSELSELTLYIAPLDRVRRICGTNALACYDGSSETIISVGEDLQHITAQSVLMHEYGHHIANNRRNDPWDAIDYGTKRWASFANVCKRADAGELAPGDEGADYRYNPGEAYAEIYRVLNERRAGVAETPWEVVDRSLYPDAEQLRLLEEDVVHPWAGNTATTLTGRFARGNGSGRVFGSTTPFDGTLRVTLRSPANSAFELRIRDAQTGRVLFVAPGTKRAKTIELSVCGQRRFTVGVRRASGFGAFSLTVSRP